MTTPAHTLKLLDDLARLGFDDRAFARLHHWRATGKEETIQSFRTYCEKHEVFQADGNNDRVTKRLELVLRAYTQGGFSSAKVEVFIALAEAAWLEVPPVTREL